jgi:hypothetical protein
MRIRALVGICILQEAMLAPAARAEGARERGPELALRLGLALPAGSINDGKHLDSYASSTVPVILEGGYRFDANLFLGARFQYAFPQLKNPNGSCSGNTSCSGSIVTLGAEGTYRFLPEQTFAPWLGIGSVRRGGLRALREHRRVASPRQRDDLLERRHHEHGLAHLDHPRRTRRIRVLRHTLPSPPRHPRGTPARRLSRPKARTAALVPKLLSPCGGGRL